LGQLKIFPISEKERDFSFKATICPFSNSVRLPVFSGGMVVEGRLIVEVGFFEGLPGCRRSDE